jgi:hypothetical protein
MTIQIGFTPDISHQSKEVIVFLLSEMCKVPGVSVSRETRSFRWGSDISQEALTKFAHLVETIGKVPGSDIRQI